MNIKLLKINDIKPYDKNPRKNDNAVDAVAASIKEFGFRQPIVIDRDNIIVAGHTRYKAAKKLKLSEVPCLMVDNLTDEQIKAYRLADNSSGELATWDLDLLKFELTDLDYNFNDFGLNIDEMLSSEPGKAKEDDFDINEALEEMETPISKMGDIWILGKHRLACGDSTSKTDISTLMGEVKANLIVTDPPYNVAYEGATKDKLTIKNDNMSNGQFREFLMAAFTRMFESTIAGGAAYVFHADREGYNFRGAFCDAGFKLAQTCIWVKNSMVMGRQDYQWQHEPVMCGEKEQIEESEFEPIIYGWNPKAKHNWHSNRKQKTVWYFDKPQRNTEHPTMKPIKLCAYPIENSSKVGDVVLDLFGGSGSTLIACEQLNRICYMMELDPKYVDVIIKRWEQFTGVKAILLNDKKQVIKWQEADRKRI